MDERIAVVVPAWREERILPRMLARAPSRASWVVVVDDGSPDQTFEVAVRAGTQDPRIHVFRQEPNQGVGAAIVRGYREAMALGAEVMVVMAGDDQMDPADFDGLVAPILAGQADYVKGNRLDHPAWRAMPLVRRMGTRLLGRLTGLVAGIPDLDDAQCGYTAITAAACRVMDLDKLFPRYGYPNDVLIRLAEAGQRVAQVPVAAVYADEVSGLSVPKVVKPISKILVKGAARRARRSIQARLDRVGSTRG